MRAGQSAQSIGPITINNTAGSVIVHFAYIIFFGMFNLQFFSIQLLGLYYIIAEMYKVQSGTKLFMDVAKNEN